MSLTARNKQYRLYAMRPLLLLASLLFGSFIWSQSQKELKQITKEYDTTALKEMISALTAAASDRKKESETWLYRNRSRHISCDSTNQNNSFQELGPDGIPIYYETMMTKTPKGVVSSSTLRNDNLEHLSDGSGMNVGIWDQGLPLFEHQEFDQRIVPGDSSESSEIRHATLVTGVLAASGAKKKAIGVIPNANAIVHDWSQDRLEAAKMAANGLLISNHSYGIKPDKLPNWYFGNYLPMSEKWDEIMSLAPYYLSVIASGNSQNKNHNEAPLFGSSEDGWDVLLGAALTKNGITVAAAHTEMNFNGVLTIAQVAPYSSLGPTDDGRIKPDIAFDGNAIYAPSGPGTKDYSVSSGTSMATAKVSGFLLLLQHYYKERYQHYLKAASIKGLALHTADDVGDKGPDYKMGWGVLNTARAVASIRNMGYSTLIVEDTLLKDTVYTLNVKARRNDNLEASLSWTDPVDGVYLNIGVVNATEPVLMNDLDIRVIKNNKIIGPWVLDPTNPEAPAITGDNSRDNYERVLVEDAVDDYTIKISHKGKLQSGQQPFSLIVTGLELMDCQPAIPKNIHLTAHEKNGVIIDWTSEGQEADYQLEYRPINQIAWSVIKTDTPKIPIANLQYGTDYEFRIKTECTATVTSEYSTLYSFTFLNDQQPVLRSNRDPQALYFPDPLIVAPVASSLLLHPNVPLSANYTIHDLSGRQLFSGSLISPKIDLPFMPKGVFILALSYLGEHKSLLFSKQ